ncbi:MAG TPA: hypothetical protein PLE61_03320 [Vicinamibacterales bacterium]|nr:hypothetical protein [Vicinamibacterales bacterium]HPW19821.1 hypothetical protein [Vicinamibacterales bacterium]
MRSGALLALVACLAPQASPLDQARADLQRRREALIRAYDLEADRPRLDAFARTIAGAFREPAIARQAPLDRLPFVARDRRDFLERTAAFVSARLGVRLSRMTVRFAGLGRGTAGRVRMVDEAAVVEVSSRHRDDDEQILAILAHEFAHIVLDAPRSGVPAGSRDEEDMADATVVMAGLGPLLLRASYREGIAASGDRVEWDVRRTGSLHPVAMAYLTLVQAELAGLDPESRRRLLGDWIEPAWTVRQKAGGGIGDSRLPFPSPIGDRRLVPSALLAAPSPGPRVPA